MCFFLLEQILSFPFIFLLECTRMLYLHKITKILFWGRMPPDPLTGISFVNMSPFSCLRSLQVCFNDVTNSYSNSYYLENPGEKRRSVAKCMEWRKKICGAQHAAGRKPVSASLTDFTLSLTNITGSSNISV